MNDQKRKFTNPTQGWVGAVVLDDDNKPKGLPVEPGGSVWLSPTEERLTAEAPRAAQDNPFTKPWREVTEFNERGEPKTWIDHDGVLVLSDEPARAIMSDRFIPSQAPRAAVPEQEEETAVEEPEELTGAPPIPKQPPVEGKPAPDEHVATPEAVAANDEHLARLATEQGDAEDEDDAVASEEEILGEAAEEGSVPLGEDGPKGPEVIGVRKAPKDPALV